MTKTIQALLAHHVMNKCTEMHTLFLDISFATSSREYAFVVRTCSLYSPWPIRHLEQPNNKAHHVMNKCTEMLTLFLDISSAKSIR